MSLVDHFVKKIRASETGSRYFWTLRDNAPEWLHNAIRDAHQTDLPNDWIYGMCQLACEAIDDGSLTEDTLSEFADSMVDIYTADRFHWAAEMCLSSTFGYAEEQAKEIGGESNDISDMLGKIQYFAIEYIAQVILNAYNNAALDDSESYTP